MGDNPTIEIDAGKTKSNVTYIGPYATDNGIIKSIGVDSFSGSQIIITAADPEMISISKEVASLREEIMRLSQLLEATIACPENAFAASEEHESVTQITDKEIAKAEILRLLEVGDVFGYSDILDKLDIDLELAVAACEDLEREGKIDQRRPAA